MRKSPRLKRLESDFRAMQRLRDESSILDFRVPGALYGGVPDVYLVSFLGRGFWRPNAKSEVEIRERHDVSIQLGAGYPRMIPELSWKTPIFHPNISANGIVCLGGYSTHWVPSLKLDELCRMLWDMIRYANYDVDSPYNREAAQWAREQREYQFPIDARPIRDLAEERPPKGTSEQTSPFSPADSSSRRQRAVSGGDDQAFTRQATRPAPPAQDRTSPGDDIVFMDDEVVEAEIVSRPSPDTGETDILFIE